MSDVLRRCNECRQFRIWEGGVHCDECKQLHRVMQLIRQYQRSFDTPEKQREHERRIPIYASLVERNVELFA